MPGLDRGSGMTSSTQPREPTTTPAEPCLEPSAVERLERSRSHKDASVAAAALATSDDATEREDSIAESAGGRGGDAARSEHGVLPLSPIDAPRRLFLRCLYWVARRRYGGKVPVAFRVVYARAPFIAWVSMLLIFSAQRFTKLPQDLIALVQVAMASAAGCTFCADIGMAEVVRAGLGAERFIHLDEWATSDAFSAREKSALAYVHALVARPQIPDEVFACLREHFDEREMTELVWGCAVERYFNTMALPLRLGSDHLTQMTAKPQ